ncbi:MAG: 3-hydroxybutyryl-CoA dehydrogenase [Deltaproteobacteria bacterium]|nr:3-hydroxybutyryl-CoA dehydrogenase [Deltaproteobacteria bacterium]
MDVKSLCVVGAGQMGAGIAQVAAQAGIPVVLIDQDQAFAQKGRAGIQAQLERAVGKGKIKPEEAAATMDRITIGTSPADAAHCDLAIEAVTENESVKRKVFEALGAALSPTAILASNTSSIPITRIAAWVKNPERVIGMHFMNPVPIMQLVELIRAIQTSDAVYATTRALAERMGKTCVLSKDMPGFIVNRILIPMINEACFALQEGLGSAADIDTAMKLGTNQPMGPLTLADFIGLDTCLYIAEVMHKGLGEDKYRPAPILRQHVEAGWLGKKTKRGFFVY